LGFKTNVFVFRGIGIFWTMFFFFVNFMWGQGCFDIYKKKYFKKIVGTS
jgi:hypothetical protein